MSYVSYISARAPSVRPVLPYLVIFAPWLLLHGGAVVLGASPILDRSLFGTDGYMRLVRVAQLHDSGAWFDNVIALSNAPYGEVLHWTRPFDVLLLLGAWMLEPFLGFRTALFWSGGLISPLLHLMSLFAVGWAVRPLLGSRASFYVMLAFLVQPALLSIGLAGRADHHMLQMLVVVVVIGLMVRALLPPFDVRHALLAGVVAGFGVWVSAELFLLAAAAAAMLALLWLRRGQECWRQNAAYAVALLAAVAFAMLVERHPRDLLTVEYDRISVVHLAFAAIVSGLWGAVWLFGRLKGRLNGARERAVLGAVAGGGALALFLLAFPGFLDGPLADADPRVQAIFLDGIAELQPLFPADPESLGLFLFFLGQALVGLPFAAFLVWRHRHDESWAAWTFLGLMLALYVALALRYLRVAPLAEIFVAIAVAALLLKTRRSLLRIANPALRALAVAITVNLLIVGFAAAGAAVMLASASADPAGETDATSRCQLRDVARYLDREDGLGDRSRIILASMNHGPELLYRTRHAVLAGPYHRNQEGILDSYTILRASDEETSRALIERRGVELILLCPSPSEEWLFGSGASEESLYRRLLADRPPSWIRAHPLPAPLADSFRLFEVIG